ncbi:winged helix-turn-helix transcriptional regulator [Candidatus Micrarchaeota archaeon]|nr:winged helix-turn-helix transcriptional regulator [Candidatus Micrarchaeota archaeon]
MKIGNAADSGKTGKADGGFCSGFFSALANRERVRILQELSLNHMSVNNLSEKIGMERTLVSHNLAMLAKAELVSHTKVGKSRIYKTNEHVVPYVFFLLERVVCSRCSIRKICQKLREKEIIPPLARQHNIRPPCEACR